ncbi:MAG: hypothetical protein KJ025_04860 [Burkholderiales bacterium]|nr:hypothetical protein [Burkholderiales bacterium]
MRRSRLKQLATVGVAFALAAQFGLASARELAEQTSHERGVTVRVKPVDLAPAAKAWKFEVVLETHSVDLSDDLARAATLAVAGTQHAPIGWDGDPPGGHHRKGVLRFAPVAPAPEALELRIQRPGEGAPRSFRWTLK